jgi:hypothetical protein
MNLLLDIAPAVTTSSIAVAAAAVFFLVFLGVAYIVFRMMRKTVKMAFRIAIVGIILLIAVAGSVALWAVATGTTEKARPTRSR